MQGNYCSTSKNCSEYSILPEEIYAKYCDENYIIKDKKCFLCKDLDNNLTNTFLKNKTCFESKPKNSYYINEKLKIFDYCMDNCDKCSNSQICEVCEKDYFKIEDKQICVEKCPKKYY